MCAVSRASSLACKWAQAAVEHIDPQHLALSFFSARAGGVARERGTYRADVNASLLHSRKHKVRRGSKGASAGGGDPKRWWRSRLAASGDLEAAQCERAGGRRLNDKPKIPATAKTTRPASEKPVIKRVRVSQKAHGASPAGANSDHARGATGGGSRWRVVVGRAAGERDSARSSVERFTRSPPQPQAAPWQTPERWQPWRGGAPGTCCIIGSEQQSSTRRARRFPWYAVAARRGQTGSRAARVAAQASRGGAASRQRRPTQRPLRLRWVRTRGPLARRAAHLARA